MSATASDRCSIPPCRTERPCGTRPRRLRSGKKRWAHGARPASGSQSSTCRFRNRRPEVRNGLTLIVDGDVGDSTEGLRAGHPRTPSGYALSPIRRSLLVDVDRLRVQADVAARHRNPGDLILGLIAEALGERCRAAAGRATTAQRHSLTILSPSIRNFTSLNVPLLDPLAEWPPTPAHRSR